MSSDLESEEMPSMSELTLRATDTPNKSHFKGLSKQLRPEDYQQFQKQGSVRKLNTFTTQNKISIRMLAAEQEFSSTPSS